MKIKFVMVPISVGIVEVNVPCSMPQIARSVNKAISVGIAAVRKYTQRKSDVRIDGDSNKSKSNNWHKKDEEITTRLTTDKIVVLELDFSDTRIDVAGNSGPLTFIHRR
jgi:type III secretory pathway component EscR